MKEQLTRLCDLIRVDLITMQGGKGSTRTAAIALILLMIGGGFCISPLAGLYVPFLLGAFFVPTLFQNEIKYHSEKLWALLPIERNDLVRSRFVLFFVIYTTSGLAVYLLMVLALKLRLWMVLFTDAEGGAMIDIVGLMAEKTGFSELGYFNVCYFGAFAFGMGIAASALRNYFRDPQKFNFNISTGMYLQKTGKKDLIYFGIIMCILLSWVLIVTGILPLDAVTPALLVIVELLMQLANAADGFLLGAVFLTMAGFHSLYAYISTLIEYDQREL